MPTIKSVNKPAGKDTGMKGIMVCYDHAIQSGRVPDSQWVLNHRLESGERCPGGPSEESNYAMDLLTDT